MKCLSVTLLGVTLVANSVLSDKWTFMKEEQRKKMEKKQEFRNVEEQKKESFSGKEKLKRTTEVYLKDEKHQLCQSVEEDDIKNTLLKFGSVLHLYDDATMFKKRIKSLVTNKKNKKEETKKLIEQSKKQIKAQARKDKEVRKKVKLNQGNFVGRSFPFSSPLKMFFNEQGSNFLEEEIERRKRDTADSKYYKSQRGRKGTLKVPLGQVPQCYGWRYLTALDALIDNSTVDVDFLTGSMSDMLDMSFASLVTSILEDCQEALTSTDPICPPTLSHITPEAGGGCEDECNPEHTDGLSDCGAGQFCCRSDCGGFKCLKTWDSDKPRKCQVADQFMQCVYQRIDIQICSGD